MFIAVIELMLLLLGFLLFVLAMLGVAYPKLRLGWAGLGAWILCEIIIFATHFPK